MKIMKPGDLIIFEESYDAHVIIERSYAILLEVSESFEWGLCRILTDRGEFLTVSSIWLRPI